MLQSFPMDTTHRIRAHFADSAQLKLAAVDVMTPHIARAAALMTDCLLADGKILACGNGGSASDAQHFAAEMVGRFERERPELPAISLATDTSILTAIANDYDFAQVFARQVRALGDAGDILLAISTSGNRGKPSAAPRRCKSPAIVDSLNTPTAKPCSTAVCSVPMPGLT